MKGYFDVHGLRNCIVTFYFPRNIANDGFLNCEKVIDEGFDCAINIGSSCFISDFYFDSTISEPFLWIQTRDIKFNISKVKCNREIEVTYKYKWHQWIARFAILAYRKLTRG